MDRPCTFVSSSVLLSSSRPFSRASRTCTARHMAGAGITPTVAVLLAIKGAHGWCLSLVLELCWAMAAMHGQPSNIVFCETKAKRKAQQKQMKLSSVLFPLLGLFCLVFLVAFIFYVFSLLLAILWCFVCFTLCFFVAVFLLYKTVLAPCIYVWRAQHNSRSV